MSQSPTPDRDRMLDLLADQVTEGLDAAERKQLDALLATEGEADLEALERTAAELSLALGEPPSQQADAMPAEVRERLSKAGREWAAGASSGAPGASSGGDGVLARIGGATGLAWFSAAAAIAIALLGWLMLFTVITQPEERFPAYADIETRPDAVRVAWSPGPDPLGEGVTGEVLWSDSAQAGWMVFRDLPPLDPNQNDYQLWIFDPTRDEHPVDGGVFNVRPDETGEVRVPIRAKLPVRSPTLFAITVEQPGGVVVSKQDRVPLVAPVEG
ncbi:MAG: anti-sigma factor [Phycisphaeraceae bacterium]|nr:MAG: anti-sigma factor [Phycisphaeraceae bacterium]